MVLCLTRHLVYRAQKEEEERNLGMVLVTLLRVHYIFVVCSILNLAWWLIIMLELEAPPPTLLKDILA